MNSKIRKYNQPEHVSTSNTNFFKKEGDQQQEFFTKTPQEPFFNLESPIQTKLTIGEPNDKYEQEADAMADQVLSKSENPGMMTAPTLEIQSKCSECEEEELQTKLEIQRQEEEEELQMQPLEEEEEELQMQPLEEEEEELQMQPLEEEEEELQMKGNPNQNTTASSGFESKLKSSTNAGEPLSKNIKQEMEAGFAADFSGVRIHNDSNAAKLSKDIGAQAFAHGNDIYFNEGKYNTSSQSGKHLLAHELTHTLQQGKSKSKPKKVQRNVLRDSNLPTHTAFTPDQTAAFAQLVQAYLDAPSNETGRAAVTAITAALEQAGEVQYNRPEMTDSSPQFNRLPSPTASQTIGSGNTVAGLTFPINGRIKVEIYPRAFTGSDVNNSLGFLTSVIIHEYIHVLQNLAGPNGSDAQREFQAWLWQAEHIAELGINTGTEAARQIVSKLRDYFNQLTDSERTRRVQRRFNSALEALAPPQPQTAPDVSQQTEEEEELQMKENAEVSSSFESALKSSTSAGEPLPKNIKNEMEAGFGVDFSNVSIHRNSEAATLSSAINAQAFTHGKDIYFNKGKYDPETTNGKHLLAHELTHTIQQKGDSIKKLDDPKASTPVPDTASKNTTSGIHTLTINDVKVEIHPDVFVKGKSGGETEISMKPKSWSYDGYDTDSAGIITKVKNPPKIPKVIIKTTYGLTVKTSETSAYGKGTTATDKKAGNTSLRFHEGSHGTDFLKYLTDNPFPKFPAGVGMKKADFLKAVEKYKTARGEYGQKMDEFSKKRTDCVGYTIDKYHKDKAKPGESFPIVCGS